jgi:predicted MPP superfamily phosphohydrolase
LSYVDDPLAQDQVKSLLSQIAAPNGVYAVLGSPTVDDREIIPHLFDDLHIQLMRDEWEAVDIGDGRQLVLMGLQCSHDLPIDRQRLNRVAKFAPNLVPQILLYHAPDLLPEAAQHGIELYLCGHTHGGQVRLPLIGAIWTSSHYGKRYEMGHYVQNRTNMYVSRGVGLEGLSAPRVRFLSPPEITLVTIRGKG